MHDDLAPITPLPPPLHHASSHQPVHQLNDRVMADLETFREHAHRRGLTPLETFDLQQQEVLLRLHACRTRGDLANPEETSDLIAQIGEGSIVQLGGDGT
jgi:hypothetical protein